jgi:DNA-binding winged helix-turn-helix (wHTH) protein
MTVAQISFAHAGEPFRTPRALPPIGLAWEPDFTLGSLRVSPSAREVTRAGWTEGLEPRVMQVLVVLHQAGGAVVPRDALIARCWGGRIVGDDAINRAIGRLRRLAKADRGASFVIETIPRVGYRLRETDGASASRTRLSRWHAAFHFLAAFLKGETP